MASYQDDVSTALKLELIGCIRDMVAQKGWTQTEAAKNLGISRSRFCRAMGGQTRDIGEGRLIQCLVNLGNDIKIIITPALDHPGKIEIMAGISSRVRNQEMVSLS